MVDAGERRPDQAQSQEKGKSVKGATTLRTQQAVARYGKAAQRPLCLAALDLWRIDAELSKWSKDLELIEEVLNSAKQMREKADTPALLRRINKHLLGAQKHYEEVNKLHSFYQDLRREPAARFKRERDAALCAGNKGAFRALARVRKRWSTDEVGLKNGKARQLEMLKMLRDTVKRAKWAKGGARGGYWEALRGGDRALDDEEWQERLTNRKIHSHIAAARGVRVAGDKDAKEIRRLARKLGLRLAEDQRGRKRKPYLPKQPKIVKRICPECLKYELEPKRRLCRYCAIPLTFVHSWVAT
jgi:hypothetical protein